jgi:hypothetical protein
MGRRTLPSLGIRSTAANGPGLPAIVAAISIVKGAMLVRMEAM